MSSISSQELAASPSASKEPGCEPSRSANRTSDAAEFSRSTGPASPATTTCEPSRPGGSGQTAFPWMSSAEAFPARTSAQRANGLGFAQSAAACGASTPELLASFDPATSSWRTSQICLVAQANGQGNGLASFSETWPRSGLMRSGTAYQLQPLARATDATEFGLWQTPVADDAVDRTVGKFNSRGEPKLSAQVKMWPTPSVTDSSQRSYQYDRGDKNKPRLSLTGLARLWPTPNAGDYKAGMSNAPGRQQSSLPRSVGIAEGVSSGRRGGLNPTWVEWLMGFPMQWTVLPNSATPSSRKSRKSSGAQS